VHFKSYSFPLFKALFGELVQFVGWAASRWCKLFRVVLFNRRQQSCVAHEKTNFHMTTGGDFARNGAGT